MGGTGDYIFPKVSIRVSVEDLGFALYKVVYAALPSRRVVIGHTLLFRNGETMEWVEEYGWQ